MKYENLYEPDCIRTSSGKYVNVFDPNPETIDLYDIAHSLNQQPRFGGHLPFKFSVLCHSINACKMADKAEKRAALLHDASEAYLMDIPRPIKNKLSNYKEVENRLMIAISCKFNFQ